MVIRKTLYIGDKEVLEHLESQGNQSKYVEELIRQDMNGVKKFWSKQDIINIIEEYLKNNQIEIKEKEEKINVKKKEIKQLTNNLLNL